MMTVLTVGCFDLLHRGHIELFRQMKNKGDWTIAIVHDDASIYENKEKFPVQSVDHRIRNIETTGLIDEIHEVHSADPTSMIEKILSKYDSEEVVYMRGNDWTDFPGKQALEDAGVEIVFKEYTEGVSSSKSRDQL